MQYLLSMSNILTVSYKFNICYTACYGIMLWCCYATENVYSHIHVNIQGVQDIEDCNVWGKRYEVG